jgi:hypothetical protein
MTAGQRSRQGQLCVMLAAVLGEVLLLSSPATPPPPSPNFGMPQFLTDHAVLQAESPRLSGWAPADAVVEILVSDGETARSSADSHGHWAVNLKARSPTPLPAARGVSITVSMQSTSGTVPRNSTLKLVDVHNDVHNDVHSSTLKLVDIVFGDVWVCSGQSNMEFAVSEMFDAAEVIPTSADPSIRLLSVSKVKSNVSQARDVPMTQDSGWQRAGPSSICGGQRKNGSQYPREQYCEQHCAGCTASWAADFKRHSWGYFSAVCYIHGREIMRQTQRPQGLIASMFYDVLWIAMRPDSAMLAAENMHLPVILFVEGV